MATEPVDVVDVLRRSGAEVLVSYLPVGSEQAQKFYAAKAIEAGVAFVNAIPVFIASNPEWAQRFTDADTFSRDPQGHGMPHVDGMGGLRLNRFEQRATRAS